MGEIANDMIEGRCCALCGQYFVKEKNIPSDGIHVEADVYVEYDHGYPVACNECWEQDCGYERQDKKVEIL